MADEPSTRDRALTEFAQAMQALKAVAGTWPALINRIEELGKREKAAAIRDLKPEPEAPPVSGSTIERAGSPASLLKNGPPERNTVEWIAKATGADVDLYLKWRARLESYCRATTDEQRAKINPFLEPTTVGTGELGPFRSEPAKNESRRPRSRRATATLGVVVLLFAAIGIVSWHPWAGATPTGQIGALASTGSSTVASTTGATVSPDPTKGPLVISQRWPLAMGCARDTKIAMPAGSGDIGAFHASPGHPFDEVLMAAGGGPWTRGILQLTLSAKNGASLSIKDIKPQIDRTDLASPAWIYESDDGCGPNSTQREFDLNLDAPQFTDAGVQMGDTDSLKGIATEKLGPDFKVSGSNQVAITISSFACRANYQWSAAIHYTIAGDSTDYETPVGPFQTYGAGNNSRFYVTGFDSTGSTVIKSKTVINGPGCQTSSTATNGTNLSVSGSSLLLTTTAKVSTQTVSSAAGRNTIPTQIVKVYPLDAARHPLGDYNIDPVVLPSSCGGMEASLKAHPSQFGGTAYSVCAQTTGGEIDPCWPDANGSLLCLYSFDHKHLIRVATDIATPVLRDSGTSGTHGIVLGGKTYPYTIRPWGIRLADGGNCSARTHGSTSYRYTYLCTGGSGPGFGAIGEIDQRTSTWTIRMVTVPDDAAGIDHENPPTRVTRITTAWFPG